MNDYTSALCRWLDGGVSPYHTVQMAAELLRAQGFSAPSEIFLLSLDGAGKILCVGKDGKR